MRELLDQMKSCLPKYNLKQPSTGNILTYRPFTVKEEKTLVIANQTGSYEDFLSTLSDIIDNCFNLPVPSKKLPIFDLEYFFLKLRSKSIGEILEPTIICPVTNEKIKITLNLDEIEPIFNSLHSKNIKISDTMLIKMKYPSVGNFIKDSNTKKDYFDLLVECIDSIETPKELIESDNQPKENIMEFVELLTDKEYRKLLEFFKTSPKLEKSIKYRTSDGTEREIILKGLRDFFQ
jgi:hypothetical protein